MARLWQVAAVAKEYGMSPARAAYEIDNDPEQTALTLLPLLRYADAYHVWKRGDKDEMNGWRGVAMMERVNEIGFEFARRELASSEPKPQADGVRA